MDEWNQDENARRELNIKKTDRAQEIERLSRLTGYNWGDDDFENMSGDEIREYATYLIPKMKNFDRDNDTYNSRIKTDSLQEKQRRERIIEHGLYSNINTFNNLSLSPNETSYMKKKGNKDFKKKMKERAKSARKTRVLQEEERRYRIEKIQEKQRKIQRKNEHQIMINEMQKQLDEDRWDNKLSLNSKSRTGAQIIAGGIPGAFLCPISHQIMSDPVIATDFHTYDRSSIQGVIDHAAAQGQFPKSPMTNERISRTQLKTNYALRDAIEHFFYNEQGLNLEEADFEGTDFNY